MARNGGKVIFLTGAPLSRSLLWDEEGLTAQLLDPFLESSRSILCNASSTNTGPVWRSLSLQPIGIHTRLTSAISANRPDDETDGEQESTPFWNTTHFSQTPAESLTDHSQSLGSSQLDEDAESDSQFYEESFAIHEEVSSSDVMGHGSSNDTPYDESFDETSNSLPTDPPADAKTNMIRTRLTASLPRNLNNLPTATYLHSITPQTLTIDLIVGIISILPPREITTTTRGRARPRTVHLIEMLVGDDTRAGFAVNIWLDDPPGPPCSPRNLATIVTQSLRPRDIILIRNAALNSFRGKVYGQTLRRGMTTIDLLHRAVIDSRDTAYSGAYSVMELRERGMEGEGEGEGVGVRVGRGEREKKEEGQSPMLKMKRVRRWVMDFVGTTTTTTAAPHPRARVGGLGAAAGDRGDNKDPKQARRERRESHHLAPLPMDTQ